MRKVLVQYAWFPVINPDSYIYHLVLREVEKEEGKNVEERKESVEDVVGKESEEKPE